MNRTAKITSTILLGMLLLLGILTFLLPQQDYSENENRILTQRPTLSAKTLLDGSYQSELTDYLSDQFPLRDNWMMAATRTKLLAGQHDIEDTYIGRDHFYFEKILNSDIDQDNYIKNLTRIDSLAEDFPELSSALLLIPSAGNILTEKLPDYAEMYDSDALYTIAEEQLTQITLVNPTAQLRAAVTDGVSDTDDSDSSHSSQDNSSSLYYRTDHHWTAWGAFIGYQALMKDAGNYTTYTAETVSDNFLGTLYSRTLDNSAICDSIDLPIVNDGITVTADGESAQLYELSCLSEKDQYQVYLGGNHGITEITNCCGTGTLLILKDSFANCLVPYLTEDYETIILIDLRYYSGSVRQYLQEHSIDALLIVYELSNFAADTSLAKLAL